MHALEVQSLCQTVQKNMYTSRYIRKTEQLLELENVSRYQITKAIYAIDNIFFSINTERNPGRS